MIERAFCNLFSEEKLDKIAKETGFIKRSRKITASAFTQPLVFSEEHHDKLFELSILQKQVKFVLTPTPKWAIDSA